MTFRKTLTLTVLLTTFFAASSQKYQGNSWAHVKSSGSGTLTVVYIEQYGLIFKDKAGKMSGVCVDILDDFAKYIKTKYGKTINVKYAGEEPVFSDFLSTVQNTPNLMGVTNTTITEERKKIFKFSPPFMLNRLVLLTHNNAPSVANLKELATKLQGFSAQVIEGSTHVDYIQKIKKDHMPSLNVSYEMNGPVIIKNLTSNQKLFTVIDLTEFIDAVHKKLPIKRHPVDIGIVEELGFIMPAGSDWDALFNEFLTVEYRNSPRYREIIAKNISSTFLSLVR